MQGAMLFCIYLTVNCFVTKHDFEAERGDCSGSCEQRQRSAASYGRTVLMQKGDQLRHSFETNSACSIGIENVRYSTDGPNHDTINISLAHTYLGFFNSISQEGDGYLWNVFKNSGPVGQNLQLLSGRYVLILIVSVDDFGIEVDKTTLNFNCDRDPGEIETGNSLSVVAIVTITTSIVVAITTVVSTAVSIYLCVFRKKRNSE